MKNFNSLKIEDLNRLGDYTHTRSENQQSLNQDAEVMLGNWSYQLLGEGLGMHYVDMEEVEDISFSNQSPAGLSFNLVYQGNIEFTLGNHLHRICADKDQPVCGCFALNRPEMRTRHTQKGMHVKKVNIFAEKKWLLERFQTEQDRVMLDKALNAHAELITWQPSSAVYQVVSELINNETAQAYSYSLQIEGKILHLLSILLGELFEQLDSIKHASSTVEDSTSELFKQSKRLIDQHLDNPKSLSDIAEQLSVSVSTLQRRFKEASGMTVVEYIRLQKLDKARRDLVEGGLSIGEIAFSAGYKHTANFVSAFKREYSMSPAAYRKLHRRADS